MLYVTIKLKKAQLVANEKKRYLFGAENDLI